MSATIGARHPPNGRGNQTHLALSDRFRLLQGQLVECTETTVNVKAHVVSRGRHTERDNIVLIAVGKVDGGTYGLTGDRHAT